MDFRALGYILSRLNGLNGLGAVVKVKVITTEKGIMLVFDGSIPKELVAKIKEARFKGGKSQKHKSDRNPMGWYWVAKKTDETIAFAESVEGQTLTNDEDENAVKEVRSFWAKVKNKAEFDKLKEWTEFLFSQKKYKTKSALIKGAGIGPVMGAISVKALHHKVYYTATVTDEEGEPGSQQSQNTPAPASIPTSQPAKGDKKNIERFRKTAESMLKVADKYTEELKHKQHNTPKRLKEFNQKRIERDILEEKAHIYNSMADAIEEGRLPAILEAIRPTLKDNDAHWFVPGSDSSGGYYSIAREDKLSHTKSAIPGLGTEESFSKALEALAEIGALKLEKDPKKVKEEKIRNLEANLKLRKIPGFFPTPESLIDLMIKETDGFHSGHLVLEPSAGKGDIAEALREHSPSAGLDVCEVNPELREILTLKGFNLVGSDFMTYNPAHVYDRIYMNPPFEGTQDIDHVTHAYELLAPGGKLAAIVSESTFFRTGERWEAFRNRFFGDYSSIPREPKNYTWKKNKAITLPDGSFKNAFNSTGVATRLVIIQRPLSGSNVTQTSNNSDDEKAKKKKKLLALAKVKIKIRQRQLELSK